MLVYENKEIKLEVYSMDINRWNDIEKLFGERGACGGCWCMAWRLQKSEFDKQKGNENKNALRKLIESNNTVGVLAYIEGKPVGWCAVAPRDEYKRLEKSRVLKRIDNEPVWSITCIFVNKAYRKKGISKELIKAAINYCKINNASIIEAYPAVPYSKNVPDAFLWTGVTSVFEEAGFIEAVKRSKWKYIMRYYI